MQSALSNDRSQRLKEKFNSWDKDSGSISQNPPVKIIPWKKYLAIAACISILIFVATNINFHQKTDTYTLFESNFTPYPSEIVRGKNSANGFTSYSNRDYNKAISAFQKDNSESSKFYLGNSFLAINEPNKAIAAFNNYSGQKYKLASQWYLALAHLQNDNISEAKIILSQLKFEKGAYGKKALALLKAL